MNILLIALVLVVCGTLISLQPSLAPGALACCAVVSLPTIIILARAREEKTDELRQRDAEVGKERGDDRPAAPLVHGANLVAGPRPLSVRAVPSLATSTGSPDA